MNIVAAMELTGDVPPETLLRAERLYTQPVSNRKTAEQMAIEGPDTNGERDEWDGRG